ncbi:MAG: hypothetical protein R2856_38690 [Caldilineaceae bacterium]
MTHTSSSTQAFGPEDQSALLAALQSSADAWNRGDLRGHVAIYDPSVTVMTNNGPRLTSAIVKSVPLAHIVNGAFGGNYAWKASTCARFPPIPPW